jgi:hypothetical protein
VPITCTEEVQGTTRTHNTLLLFIPARCEEDYDVSPLVKEFWNTISNLAYLLAGAYALSVARKHRLGLRHSVLAWCLVLTGAFSALFHATLVSLASFCSVWICAHAQ